jgi:hypothetical protein
MPLSINQLKEMLKFEYVGDATELDLVSSIANRVPCAGTIEEIAKEFQGITGIPIGEWLLFKFIVKLDVSTFKPKGMIGLDFIHLKRNTR